MDSRLKLNALASAIGSLTDEDGNVYTTVTIGTQTWMVENLKTTKYNDGTPIVNLTTDASWSAATDDAYCWYNNDATTYKVYGALYNQWAAQNSKLPPVGWKVPSYADWATLVSYIGGEASAGLKLKEAGTTHWNATNNATNEYGFTALGGGERSNTGLFHYFKTFAFWWTVLDTAVYVTNSGDGIVFPTGYDYKHGEGIRCIQDSAFSSQSTTNKLRLSGGNESSVLNFDGSAYVHYSQYDTSLFGRLDLEFNLWLDATNNYNAGVLLLEPSNNSGSRWSMYLQDSSIYVEQNNGFYHYSINNRNNQILSCIIRKDETSRAGPEFFKINGVEQTGSAGEPVGITGYFNQSSIGMGIFRSGTSDKLVNGTVWNVKVIEVSTGNLIRYWKGYPHGSLDSAWVDNVGNADMTVETSNPSLTLTERLISGAGNESGGGNKLLLGENTFIPKFGLLYNWFAVVDASNIANTDWHAPSRTEWETLTTYLGGESVAGVDVKLTGYTHWNYPNTGAANSAGFNAPGGGGRDYTGPFGTEFNILKEICWFWSTTEYVPLTTSAWQCACQYDSTFFGDGSNDKNNGYSVRLIKDTTSLSDGETGTYTGNDGTVYATICIGTQEWLSSNLKETKYRDGTPIPEVTGNAAWAALSTGAMCAYNNDWGYV